MKTSSAKEWLPLSTQNSPLSSPAGGSHRQDNIWRVSQPAAMEDHAEPTLLLPLTYWDFLLPSVLPLKTLLHDCSKSLSSSQGHESTFSLKCWLFWLCHLSFLFTLASGFWAASSCDLSSVVTRETRPLVTCIVISVQDGFLEGHRFVSQI